VWFGARRCFDKRNAGKIADDDGSRQEIVMSGKIQIEIPKERIAEFCQRHHIRRLSLFGSVLREDFRPESDVDVLVEFEPGHIPGFAFFGMEEELSRILGRKVDLNTPNFLSRYFRNRVMEQAEVQYAEQ
jgi:predicted nucleotidyltransferase